MVWISTYEFCDSTYVCMYVDLLVVRFSRNMRILESLVVVQINNRCTYIRHFCLTAVCTYVLHFILIFWHRVLFILCAYVLLL